MIYITMQNEPACFLKNAILAFFLFKYKTA